MAPRAALTFAALAAAAPPRAAPPPPASLLAPPGATLTALPALLSGSEANVTLAWAGVANATAGDWLGVWCADAPANATHPARYLDFAWASAAPTFAAGAGALVVAAHPARCALVWRYVRALTLGPTVAAAAAPVAFAPRAPYHVRLSLAGDGSGGGGGGGGAPGTVSAWVSWTSDDGTAPAAVALGAAPSALARRVPAAPAATYDAADMCGPAARRDVDWFMPPGFFHHARVDGLAPRTTYWYSVGQEGGEPSSPANFTTPDVPRGGASARFFAVADVGAAYRDCPGGPSVLAALRARVAAGERADAVLLAGDVAYGMGSTVIWDAFARLAEPLAARVPMVVGPGNHELDWPNACRGASAETQRADWFNGAGDSRGEAGVPFFARFRGPAAGAHAPWGAVDLGPVHIVLWSTEHSWGAGAPQRAWLEAHLRGVDRARSPWLVLAQHRPMLNVEDFASDARVGARMAADLEPLLLEARVDAVLAGHYHAFLRTCAAARGACAPRGARGIVHVTLGNGGADLDGDAPLNDPGRVSNFFDGAHFGFAVVEANETTLALDYFRAGAPFARVDGVVLER